MDHLARIGVLTGGGDCPGLNAVIRAVTNSATRRGIQVVGILDGYLGLIENRSRPLATADVRRVLCEGGTILGASNRADPFRFIAQRDGAAATPCQDVSDPCLRNIEALDLDALIVVGGDGTMTIAAQLAARLRSAGSRTRLIGIPKTIDNDLFGTDLSFGFLSAVHVATEALDRVRTTAASHHRAMVVEVMGRNAGWIALHSGVAGGADAILLPEIPFSFDAIVHAMDARRAAGERDYLICVAEGARPIGGTQTVARLVADAPHPIRLGGVAALIADQIEQRAGVESRFCVLGHVQRGGAPVAEDRVLGTLFGCRAVDLLREGATGRMVAMRGAAGMDRNSLTSIDLAEVAAKQRLVPVGNAEHSLIDAARKIGTCFGDV